MYINQIFNEVSVRVGKVKVGEFFCYGLVNTVVKLYYIFLLDFWF